VKQVHGGNLRRLAAQAGLAPEQILDFSASINPLGPPDWFSEVAAAALLQAVRYPDPECAELIQAIAARKGCREPETVAGNGSSELLFLLPRAVKARRAVIPVPAYLDYEATAAAAEIPVVKIAMAEETGFASRPELIAPHLWPGDIVFLGYPANPSGALCAPAEIRALAAAHPQVTVVVDEAFLDFVAGVPSLAADRPTNVVVLMSFTKMYAIPGLRLGAAAADEAVAERLRAMQPRWSVNGIAQAVGVRALADVAFVRETQQWLGPARDGLQRELEEIPGFKVFPGRANYLLVKIEDGSTGAAALANTVLHAGIAIRSCANFDGLDDRFFRVAVRTEDENARLVAILRDARGVSRPPRRVKRARSLMFQGTCSNAGKSVLTAAMCRILFQEGVSVAPFKSQNMALNSFVTLDGREMGRAQVVQAQACRLDPDVRMNPVLLKPSSDTGSQVIVNGRPVGNMQVAEYVRYKPQAFAAAKAAYDSLAADFDVVVLEGAGSPAEVNLKSHDIVNMNMARYAESPVLLVGDIDRGGVFASFVGTMECLTAWERKLLAGFVVNKFRGDARLLEDALAFTLRRTGKPIYGVVPYLKALGLPEEDSLGFRNGSYHDQRDAGGCVKIAVVDLPHISNFTDLDPFKLEPDVRLQVARVPADLDGVDAVIIPGSKNVMADLPELIARGLGEKIVALAGAGVPVVGICGGFQILGREVRDPHGLEGAVGGALRGLGLLPVTNVLEREKTLARAEALHVASGLTVRGYEIHHGQLSGEGWEPGIVRADGETVGVSARGGAVWGTYLHGIFDDDEFRRWFIDRLRESRGLAPLGKPVAIYDLEQAFERLAAAVRESIDLKGVLRLVGLA